MRRIAVDASRAPEPSTVSRVDELWARHLAQHRNGRTKSSARRHRRRVPQNFGHTSSVLPGLRQKWTSPPMARQILACCIVAERVTTAFARAAETQRRGWSLSTYEPPQPV